MIGPGTGSVPFRAFFFMSAALPHDWPKLAPRKGNRVHCFLYSDELESMRVDGHLTQLNTAFSRDQNTRFIFNI